MKLNIENFAITRKDNYTGNYSLYLTFNPWEQDTFFKSV